MGIFTSMLVGALGGAGQGLVGAGQQMAAAEDARLREEAYMQRLDAKAAQQEEQIRLREELRAEREEQNAKRKGGGSGGPGEMSGILAENGLDLRALAVARSRGALTRGDVDAGFRYLQGEDITAPRPLPGPPTEEGAGPGEEPAKYTPGSAKDMLIKFSAVLDEALAINVGGNTDQVAKGLGELQNTSIQRATMDGEMTPAKGAQLVGVSKGDGGFGSGGVNKFTGDPDQVGKSVIDENKAQAAAAGASAAASRARAELERIRAGDKDPSLPALTQLRQAATSEVEAARLALRNHDLAMEDAHSSQRPKMQAEREALAADLKNKQVLMSDVTKALQESVTRKQTTGETKPDKKPDPKKPDMAAANAIKAELAAGKIKREEAVRRLRELGFK